MPEHSLKNPNRLDIETPRSRVAGGSQHWYADKWRRMSGCGPTAAANLVWYLSNSEDRGLAAFRALQEEMFGYVTPGFGGVNNSRIFTEGIAAYARTHNMPLAATALDIPQFRRPSAKEALDFIAAGLDSDCPVAFLNLSNGNQQQLDSWHWVTIIGLTDNMTAKITDQTRIIEVNVREWLCSTMLGGAFVYVKTELQRAL
jgi:hypothetical protein